MRKKSKNITILGSTGSIGTSTLKLVDNFSDDFNVIGLSANKNISLLRKQIKKFNPIEVALYDKNNAEKIKNEYPDLNVYSGFDGILKLCRNKNVDLIIQALVGSIGIKPTLECINNKIDVAIANKEPLVCAGKIIMNAAKQQNVNIIPVDSEHSAILQCLAGHQHNTVSKIILTASGGSFLNFDGDFNDITIEQALKHPNWSMGKKITIDSATLVNKGLELIEAMHLFNMPADKIDIIIHPQSIIHSMVEYVDGVVIAQLSQPDMLFPIQYALFNRYRKNNRFKKLDFTNISKLNFIEPDLNKFQCLDLCIKVARKGGLYPAVLCQTNDIIVERFLNGEISFIDIYYLLEKTINSFKNNKFDYNLDDVFDAMKWASEFNEV
jgi:1-deoxy-D-xylulose-5-phosphate reductoisomerase